MTDAEIAGYMDWRGPGAYTERQLVRIRRIVEEARRRETEACAGKVEVFARKWWSIHCDTNKHRETTRKAHDDFCTLQAMIRARGQA